MAGNKKNNTASEDDVITIKKYANRRLYNTATSSYVTLDYLAEMVRSNEEFVVYDAKSGEDITRSVLTQIIFEEENKGQNMLPVNFLRQIISYYGDNMQSFVPSYLEMSMDAFRKNQEAMRKTMSETFSEAPGMKMFEDVARQNMALFEQGMQLFGMGATNSRPEQAGNGASELEAENAELKRQIAELKAQVSKK